MNGNLPGLGSTTAVFLPVQTFFCQNPGRPHQITPKPTARGSCKNRWVLVGPSVVWWVLVGFGGQVPKKGQKNRSFSAHPNQMPPWAYTYLYNSKPSAL